MITTVTNPSARDTNRATVMDLVMRRADLTRSTAVALSGLSKATVSPVVDELLVDGFVVEGADNQTVGRGRPSRFLAAAPALGYVIGVVMGITTTRLLAADIDGHTLAKHRLENRHSRPRGRTRRMAASDGNRIHG